MEDIEVTPAPYDDSNWRQEFKDSKLLSKFQLEILEMDLEALLNHGFLVQCMETGRR